MLNRFKNVVANAVGGVSSVQEEKLEKIEGKVELAEKFPYSRPNFLQLTEDEVQVSADHTARPILLPRQFDRLPWHAGYAEVINAGKSKLNEDQARAEQIYLRRGTSSCGVTLRVSPKHSPQHVPKSTQSHTEEINGIHDKDQITKTEEIPAESGDSRSVLSENTEKEAEIDYSAKTGQNISDSPEDLSSKNKESFNEKNKISFTYFAIFDGHAGTGAALMASHLLHTIIQTELTNVVDLIIARRNMEINTERDEEDRWSQGSNQSSYRPPTMMDKLATVTEESLVTGALEIAFHQMDDKIKLDREWYKIPGGCTALVAVFLLGKLYIANAGDCRAIIDREDGMIPMSTDFTPITERQRIQHLAYLQPELLHGEFTHLEFPRRMTARDIGKRMLYRDAWMTGWSCKTIEDDDTKFPLVHGEGKRARVLATIGVTRGFGDHGLMVYSSDIQIKPFLLSTPEVKVYDLYCCEHTVNDVLIMGSDGLWDVTTNARAAHIVRCSLEQFGPDEKCRYTSAAQDLVMYARGLLNKGWRTPDDTIASGDDITAFVIPLSAHKLICEPVFTENT